MEIDPVEEFAIDWDWFACDEDEHIAHFTSAGRRFLPASIKRDKEATERAAHYFLQVARPVCGFSVREVALIGLRLSESPDSRDRYLKCYVEMAEKGLYSFDSQLKRGNDGCYSLVAIPHKPLELSDLPKEIASLISRTRSPFQLSTREYISEYETLNW